MLYQLRCNEEKHPISIEKSEISLSFKLNDDNKSIDTSKVIAQISTSENFEKDVIFQKQEDGEVIFNIVCDIKNLKSHTKYYY